MLTILDKKYYTFAEVATLFGVSKASIHAYKKEKGLKVVSIGGKKYVSEDGIRDFIREDLTALEQEPEEDSTADEVEEPQRKTKKRTYLAV